MMDTEVNLTLKYRLSHGYNTFLFFRTLCLLYFSFPLGEEVALYCSKYLPDIIKEQKTYKDGKLQKVMLCPDPL